jgi:hypothetical protein
VRLIDRIKRELARRKLAEDVERRRNSFECEQYRRRRAAALKHTRGLGA